MPLVQKAYSLGACTPVAAAAAPQRQGECMENKQTVEHFFVPGKLVKIVPVNG